MQREKAARGATITNCIDKFPYGHSWARENKRFEKSQTISVTGYANTQFSCLGQPIPSFGITCRITVFETWIPSNLFGLFVFPEVRSPSKAIRNISRCGDGRRLRYVMPQVRAQNTWQKHKFQEFLPNFHGNFTQTAMAMTAIRLNEKWKRTVNVKWSLTKE